MLVESGCAMIAFCEKFTESFWRAVNEVYRRPTKITAAGAQFVCNGTGVECWITLSRVALRS